MAKSPAQAIAAHLVTRELTTQAAQAIALKEHPQAWNAHLRAKREPKTAKLEAWCKAADVSLAYHPRTGWTAKQA